jgi:hypothetical protein
MSEVKELQLRLKQAREKVQFYQNEVDHCINQILLLIDDSKIKTVKFNDDNKPRKNNISNAVIPDESDDEDNTDDNVIPIDQVWQQEDDILYERKASRGELLQKQQDIIVETQAIAKRLREQGKDNNEVNEFVNELFKRRMAALQNKENPTMVNKTKSDLLALADDDQSDTTNDGIDGIEEDEDGEMSDSIRVYNKRHQEAR